MNYTTSSLLSLISRIHTLSADYSSRNFSEKNFASSHGYILYLLSINDKMTMGEIAKSANRDKSTTTVLIRKLEKEGLVSICQCENDSRIKEVFLTEEGKKYNNLTKEISSNLLSVCYKNFSQEEKNQLLNLLIKLEDNLKSV